MEPTDCKPGTPVIYWSHRAPDGQLSGVATETVITSPIRRTAVAEHAVMLQGITVPIDIRNLVPNSANTF